MSRINEKLGLKPAGKRAFMHLPADRQLRARLTSAPCPTCGSRGARLVTGPPVMFWWPCCNVRRAPPEGLREQGHGPTVERMLAEGATWQAIGVAIGWDPEAAREAYASLAATVEGVDAPAPTVHR